MINRKNKIRFIQTLLLLISVIIIFNTYFTEEKSKNIIITSKEKERLKNTSKQTENADIFYNIKYSGLDLAGNRYVLTSQEAIVDKNLKEIVNMKFVDAIFYFKDDTILIVNSEFGTYNNKTLDMVFEKNVKANYQDSELYGDKIVYLNTGRTLEISENVILNDIRGTMSADNLLFDLETKKLDISSYNNKINTNLNIKWKKVLQYSNSKKLNQYLKLKT